MERNSIQFRRDVAELIKNKKLEMKWIEYKRMNSSESDQKAQIESTLWKIRLNLKLHDNDTGNFDRDHQCYWFIDWLIQSA